MDDIQDGKQARMLMIENTRRRCGKTVPHALHRALHRNAAGVQDRPMSSSRPLLVLLLALLAGSGVAQDKHVTVYRCIDDKGKVALQDKPCDGAQTQQTRTMKQSYDPPPAPATTAPAQPPAATPVPTTAALPAASTRAPQPMYACIKAEDGSTYISDTGVTAPRWVSIWALDELYYPSTGVSVSSGNSSVTSTGNRGGATVGGNRGGIVGGRPRPGRGHGAASAGTWVQDECHVLPQAETCARLHDRRDEVRTRIFNAQEKERATLSTEERGINARLDADCGGH